MSILSGYINKVATLLKTDQLAGESCQSWSGAISSDILITECPFVVFDTELSGLNYRKDFIVSIGAIKMTGGTIHAGGEFYRLIKPEGEMTKKSVEIHGITPDDLMTAENLEAVIPDFLEFIADSVLVGHFIHIDLRFLNASLKKLPLTTLTNPAVDTHTLHEWLLDNAPEFRKHFHGGSLKTDLFSVAERYGVPVDSAHNALNDAFITAQLLQRFIYFFKSQGINTLRDLLDIGRA